MEYKYLETTLELIYISYVFICNTIFAISLWRSEAHSRAVLVPLCGLAQHTLTIPISLLLTSSSC